MNFILHNSIRPSLHSCIYFTKRTVHLPAVQDPAVLGAGDPLDVCEEGPGGLHKSTYTQQT